jgi:hypothetical protein
MKETAPSSPEFFAEYYQIWPILGMGEMLSDASFTEVKSKWEVNMDIFELTLGRWHYTGTRLTCHPFAGLRGALIRQNVHVKYTHFDFPPPQHFPLVATRMSSNSWAIGPEMGLDLNWKIMGDLNLISSLEGDLLYTQYTRLHDTNTSAGVGSPSNPRTELTGTVRDLECVRGHLDMMIGLGWGKKIRCERYYWGFNALYEFQIFFDQNMFHRYFASGTVASVRQGLTTIGNLYLQGLTVSSNFHF